MSKVNSPHCIPRAIKNFGNIRSTAYQTMQSGPNNTTVSLFVRQDVYDLLAVANYCVKFKRGKGLAKRIGDMRKDVDRYEYRESDGVMMVKLDFNKFIDFLNDVLTVWATVSEFWQKEMTKKMADITRKRENILEARKQYRYEQYRACRDNDIPQKAQDYARKCGFADVHDFAHYYGYKTIWDLCNDC